ncbi:MAG: Protease HtpX [Candidatus Argoarchaeum ethanivorans]|uniref:Protease HtpX n=1 Tax=Candidatus Argoarchaeum ethanivorans TaxID=2608793 RepID=A0A811T971_9EURY|nr:MAG: Protease HtpX [Candidatus Argoarchaeum ethanivorans]
MNSRRRLLFLWIGFTVLMVVAGEAAGRMIGVEFLGMIVMFAFISLLALSVYFYSDRILLRWYHAEGVKNDVYPSLHEIIAKLSKKMELPIPRVYVVDSPMPNTFTLGRNTEHSSIVVTDGLMELLDHGEIEAVLAHELAHIKEGGTPVAGEVGILAGFLTALASVAFWASIFTGFGQEDDPAPNLIRFFVTALVAPPAATIIQVVMSRSREYMADEKSASIHGKGDELASALQRIDNKLKTEDSYSFGVNPSHAHLFIVNPFHGNEFRLMDISLPTYYSLFCTHPQTGERVRRLKKTERDDEPMRSSGEYEIRGLIKPFFFSSIAYISVLFAIIVIDTFSMKDFVFARALIISVVYLGILLLLFAFMSLTFRSKLKTV